MSQRESDLIRPNPTGGTGGIRSIASRSKAAPGVLPTSLAVTCCDNSNSNVTGPCWTQASNEFQRIPRTIETWTIRTFMNLCFLKFGLWFAKDAEPNDSKHLIISNWLSQQKPYLRLTSRVLQRRPTSCQAFWSFCLDGMILIDCWNDWHRPCLRRILDSWWKLMIWLVSDCYCIWLLSHPFASFRHALSLLKWLFRYALALSNDDCLTSVNWSWPYGRTCSIAGCQSYSVFSGHPFRLLNSVQMIPVHTKYTATYSWQISAEYATCSGTCRFCLDASFGFCTLTKFDKLVTPCGMHRVPSQHGFGTQYRLL